MTDKEAKEYIDNYISHAIGMVEYGNYFYSEIQRLVDDCLSDCNKILKKYKNCPTKSKSNECRKDLQKRLENFEADVSIFVNNQVYKIADEEKEWLEKNVEKPLGIKFTYTSKFNSLLLLIPISTAGIVSQYGETLRQRIEDIYEQEIMASYVSGDDFDEVEEMFENRFLAMNRGIKTDSLTLGESLGSQYDRIVYTKNDNKITGYVWSAILDTTTCLACGEMDGRKFDSIADVPMYPMHQNCRCTLIVYDKYTEGSIPETYSEWFEGQSDKDKRKILGKTRFELYENGMKITQFVNNGKITLLKDLKK